MSGFVADNDHRDLLAVIGRLCFVRSLDAVIDIVGRAARRLTGADGATFVLREGDHCYYADEDAIAPLWKGRRFPIDACISGWVMRNATAAVIEDIYADARIPADAYRPTFVRSLAMVPVRTEDPIAAIGAYWAVRRQPDAREVEVLRVIADASALALANVELYARLDTALEQARAANRAKDQFLSVLSHELRTPLNSLLGWVSMLRSGSLDASTARRALDVLDRSVRQQTQLIGDLVEVSRIMTGRIELQLDRVDLRRIVVAAMDRVRPLAAAKSIALVLTTRAGMRRVCGDATRLERIAGNLLANAVKFTPERGRVEVALDEVDGRARLMVKDNGKGIAADFLPHIFERFRQADSSTTRAHGGLGVGLAIVRHLVELHGGTVTAESPGEDAGAVFTVALPLADEVETGADGPGSLGTSRQGLAPLRGLRVLAVDDDLDTRELALAILEDAGAEARAAASAHEALQALRTWRADVVVCDIAMPDVDGYALIAQLRATATDVLAIALTAHARPEDRGTALGAGFAAYLSKPIEPHDLVAAIGHVARRATV